MIEVKSVRVNLKIVWNEMFLSYKLCCVLLCLEKKFKSQKLDRSFHVKYSCCHEVGSRNLAVRGVAVALLGLLIFERFYGKLLVLFVIIKCEIKNTALQD